MSELPPAGLSWAAYVARWVDDCGGWLPLADALIARARGRFEVPDDPQTVERGLRRLARREHKPGGQYGRWMLRLFGVTSSVEQWVRWLGTGHTRFADLPAGLRLEQLTLWNRPPIAETPLVAWIELGIAHAHHSRLDHAACDHWLARAALRAPAAGPAAELELLLAQLETESDSRRHATAPARLAAAEALVADATDGDVYRARLAIQRAVLCTRPPAGEPLDVAGARAHYAAIPDSAVPYVACSRALGLAYCAWSVGDASEAAAWATRAIDEAGDGGLVRMRVRALNMLSRILAPHAERAAEVHARARRIATMLEDEELLRRVTQSAPR